MIQVQTLKGSTVILTSRTWDERRWIDTSGILRMLTRVQVCFSTGWTGSTSQFALLARTNPCLYDALLKTRNASRSVREKHQSLSSSFSVCFETNTKFGGTKQIMFLQLKLAIFFPPSHPPIFRRLPEPILAAVGRRRCTLMTDHSVSQGPTMHRSVLTSWKTECHV